MNKKILVILFLFIFSVSLYAENHIAAKQKLIGVKVFISGAELTHTAKVKLQKGVSNIVFSNLSSNIDENSINISAKGKAIILSVTKRFNYLKPGEKSVRIKQLEDSLKILKYSKAKLLNKLQVLDLEVDLITSNKIIGGKNSYQKINELKKMVKFYENTLPKLKDKMLAFRMKELKLRKMIDAIRKQLKELNNQKQKPVNEIIITVSAQQSTLLQLRLTYLTYNAGWKPDYDIRVKNINSKADLYYKGAVWQNTGINWRNVNITLSTRNPIVNNNAPVLYPWFINFYTPHNGRRLFKSNAFSPAAKMLSAKEGTRNLSNYTKIIQTQMAAEFTPSIRYSIPPDGKIHLVSIKKYELPAKYEYLSIPKLDKNAFLITTLSNWSSYNLLPGNANIYFENSYVGKTFINPFTAGDSLTISLGRDQNIIVKRKLLKDFTEKKFLSSNVERTFGYEILVKNNKTINIKIVVEDQLPISKNEDIEVFLKEKSGAKYDEKTGLLQWNLNLSPSSLKKLKFVYMVEYPKGKIIKNL